MNQQECEPGMPCHGAGAGNRGGAWPRTPALSVLTLMLILTVAACGPKSQTPPNVVVVVLDTLRRDATSLAESRHSWGQPTPNLDELATVSRSYPNAWSPAPWTVPAHASLLTGLLPAAHGCDTPNLRLGSVGPTLAERLGAAGYETAAFFANPWLSDRTTGLLRGFEIREEVEIGGLSELHHPSGDQGGAATVENAARWLERRDRKRPFLLFVNLFEAHVPYDPPADLRQVHQAPAEGQIDVDWTYAYHAGLYPPETVDWTKVARLYAGDAHYADRYLGMLLDQLKRHDLFDDAVIIVTSDHGENLGEHGLFEHVFSLHETLLAIPLVVKGPAELFPPGSDARPALLSDLYATILEVAGVPEDGMARSSVSLLAPGGEADRPLFGDVSAPGKALLGLLTQLNPDLDVTPYDCARRTVRVGAQRLTATSCGGVELHDCVHDPAQTRNLVAERPVEAERLGQLLAQHALQARETPGVVLDAETRERLRSLGYIN